MGQAKEFERILNKYLIEYKKDIKRKSAIKAMEEKGLPKLVILQIVSKLYR